MKTLKHRAGFLLAVMAMRVLGLNPVRVMGVANGHFYASYCGPYYHGLTGKANGSSSSPSAAVERFILPAILKWAGLW